MKPIHRVTVALALALALMFPLLAMVVGLQVGPRITPNDEFFTASINGTPQIDGELWRLSVRGMVDSELSLGIEEIRSLPRVSLEARLQCVGGPSGNAVWAGVPLEIVLEMAQASSGATEVIFRAADGYSSSLTVAEISETGAFLAYEMNGVELPPDHGFPLRLVVPGHYGYKWVKWVTSIELAAYDYEGYWESRGWNDDARMTELGGWLPHAVALSVGFIFVGFAVASGYAGRPGKAGEWLPEWMAGRFHSVAGMLGAITVAASFIWWALETLEARGALFYSGHGIMSGVLLGLIAASGATGAASKRYRWAAQAHEYTSLFAFVMYAGVIVTGLLRSGLF